MRDILEILYFISGIGLFVVGIIALIQIKIGKRQITIALKNLEVSKKDIEIRSLRESINLAAVQSEIFVKEIVPIANEINELLAKSQITIPKLDYETYSKMGKNEKNLIPFYIFYKENNELATEISSKILKLLNSLEVLSVYFLKNIADNEVGIKSIGLTFCNIYETYYYVAVGNYEGEKAYYLNIIELYKQWKEKLNFDSLEKLYIQREEELKKIKQRKDESDRTFKSPLGTDLI